jgi:hypothetical protein
LNEKTIEGHLRHYNTYRVGIVNCEKQLEYIMPNTTAKFDFVGNSSFVANTTEKVALDRIESLRALELHETINRYRNIVDSIDRAIGELQQQEIDFIGLRYFNCMQMQEVTKALGYAEEKSVYRIRRHTLDKLQISLKNLLDMEQ